jgi:hypothetical protein
MNERYLLTNVRLEQGFIRRQGVVQGTECAEFTLDIIDGRIHALYAGTQRLPGVAAQDGRGYLMLPVTRDEHIHLDKTFYGGPWRAARENGAQDIFEMIALEQEILPELLPTSVQRTHALLQLLQQQGTTYVRSHCNIEPVSGLQSLRHLLEALAPWREQLQCEIVAFPQHGLLRSGSLSLMRKALAMGASGSVAWIHQKSMAIWSVRWRRPWNWPSKRERVLITICMRINPPALPVSAIYWMPGAGAGAAWKLTLSHAYCLAQIDREELSELAGRMAALGVSLATCLPIGKDVMPLPFSRARRTVVKWY